MKDNVFEKEMEILKSVNMPTNLNNCYLLRSKNPEMIRLLERKRMTRELDMKYDNIPLTDFIESPQILLEPGQEPEPEQERETDPESETEQSHELEPEQETSTFSEILKSMKNKKVAVVIGINHSGDDKDSERYLDPEGGSIFVPRNCNILYIQPPNCRSNWKLKNGGGNDMSDDLFYGLIDINFLEILDKYKSCNFESNDECVSKFMGEIGEAGFRLRWKLNGIPAKEKFKITDKMTPQYYSPGEKLTDVLYTNEGRLELLLVINGEYVSIDIGELFRATGKELIPECEFRLSEIIDRFFIYLDNEFNFRQNENRLIVSMASCRS